MNTEFKAAKHEGLDEITERIIGCAMRVSNELGAGFLEKVYENAMMIELGRNGLEAESQKVIQVCYFGAVVGDFFADIVVENRILLELKATKAIDEIHQAQLLNYLKATGMRVGLIINFGSPRVGIKRMVL